MSKFSENYARKFEISLRKDKIRWSNFDVIDRLGTYLLNKEVLTHTDIERFEMMLLLIQNDLVKSGELPILVYKSYIYDCKVYHIYVSDVLRIRSIKKSPCGGIYSKNKIVNKYKNMSYQELKEQVEFELANNNLNPEYFILSEYSGPSLKGYARFTNTIAGKVYFITFRYVMISILLLLILLIIVAFYFLGSFNVDSVYLSDRLKSGAIVLIICTIINYFILKKVKRIYRTPTEYENKLKTEDKI